VGHFDHAVVAVSLAVLGLGVDLGADPVVAIAAIGIAGAVGVGTPADATAGSNAVLVERGVEP
jgi:predicted histidine transporter YuiF (NhaC family)